jgi:hypothetical protein
MQQSVDQTGRRYRNEKIFELTKAALTGLLANKTPANNAEIESAAKAAVIAAKFAARELITERII